MTMDAGRFRRVEALFHRALELDDAARARLLEETREEDPELAREVERLLSGDDHAEEGVERLELFAVPDDPLLGRRLGPWRVVERIAEGGMGVVYRAERADGLYDQQVAVKLLRLEIAPEVALRRFELERRLLARLEHPNISRMLDGGRSEQGTPYLVMEFVDGLPIDRWCSEHALPLEERLRLFASVCRAVHYAHQNLVVHRDLKPSNVMVDRHGVAKLLDFGIARLLDEDDPVHTHTGARALTPQYASPEQLQGLPLTTASDVYSLGVVLYELLTGRRPWLRTGRSPAEWERIVTREPPTRPSTAVQPRHAEASATAAAFAASLHTTPARLHRRLRGDLDRIVLMALRKEPERRYTSAEQLAEDVERYLGGLPVRARRDTVSYRAQRFVQRNALAVGSAALVVLALCGGLWISWRARLEAEDSARIAREQEDEARVARIEAEQSAAIADVRRAEAMMARRAAEESASLARAQETEARRARQAAERSAELAREREQEAMEAAEHARIEADSFRLIAEFLGETFLQRADGVDDRQRVATSVERQAARVRLQYADDPHIRANLLDALGRVYLQLGILDPAGELMREALEIRLRFFGEGNLEYALSRTSLGQLSYQRGSFEDAALHLETALRLHRTLPRGVHTDVAGAANDLASVYRNLGRLDEAQELHEEALAIRRASGETTPAVAESLHNLALVLLDRGQPEAARARVEEALEIRDTVLGADHPLSLQTRIALAGVEYGLGRLDEAERHLREAVEGYRELREGGREGLINALSNLSAVQIVNGELERAEESAIESLQLVREHAGDDDPQTATALSRLATIRGRRGNHEAAREAWREVLRIRRELYPDDAPQLARTLHSLALAHLDAGDAEGAEPLLREALERIESSPVAGAFARDRAAFELSLGACYLDLDRPEEARRLLERARDRFLEAEGDTSSGATRARQYLSRMDG